MSEKEIISIFKRFGMLAVGFGAGFVFDNYMKESPQEQHELKGDSIQVYFTCPKKERNFMNFKEIEGVIIREIDKARQSIMIHAYGWTSAPISQAVLKARKRGVFVKMVVDKQYERQFMDQFKFLPESGAEIRIRHIHGISHIKMIVIDEETVLAGSYNYSKGANNKNDEMIFIVKNADIAAKCVDNINKCYDKAFPIGQMHNPHAKNTFWDQDDGVSAKVKNKPEAISISDVCVAIESAQNRIQIYLADELDPNIESALNDAANRFIKVKCIMTKKNVGDNLITSNIQCVNSYGAPSRYTTLIIDNKRVFRIEENKISESIKANTKKESDLFEKKFSKAH